MTQLKSAHISPPCPPSARSIAPPVVSEREELGLKGDFSGMKRQRRQLDFIKHDRVSLLQLLVFMVSANKPGVTTSSIFLLPAGPLWKAIPVSIRFKQVYDINSSLGPHFVCEAATATSRSRPVSEALTLATLHSGNVC